MLRVYLKPSCSTCRDLVDLLEARGVEFDEIDYYAEPLGEDRLRGLVIKAGGRARELLRTRDRPELATLELTEDELIGLILGNPDLVARPIVERCGRALVARPPDRVLELLDPV